MTLHLEETNAVTDFYWKNYSAGITVAKKLFPKTFGAGEGNRTLVPSLENSYSAIELHPQ